MDWDDDGPTEDVSTVLADLLDAGRRNEVVWKASGPFGSFADYARLEEVRSQYRELFDDAVAEVTEVCGPPRFLGDRARPGFPAWSDAAHLAIWVEDDDLASYVAVVQVRRDDPVELRVGVR